MRCNTCGCDDAHRTPTIEVSNPSGFFFSLLSRLMLFSAGVALFMSPMHPLHAAVAGFLVVSAIVGIIGDVFNG